MNIRYLPLFMVCTHCFNMELFHPQNNSTLLSFYNDEYWCNLIIQLTIHRACSNGEPYWIRKIETWFWSKKIRYFFYVIIIKKLFFNQWLNRKLSFSDATIHPEILCIDCILLEFRNRVIYMHRIYKHRSNHRTSEKFRPQKSTKFRNLRPDLLQYVITRFATFTTRETIEISIATDAASV